MAAAAADDLTLPASRPLAGAWLQRSVALVTVVAVAVLFGIGAWMQAQVHLNHDVAWITHSARWMLEGRRFGSEIVDINPPLIWFFSLPAAALTKAGLLSEPSALRLYMWLVCLGALTLCHRLLQPLREAGRPFESAAIVLAAAFALAIVSAASFGQREFVAFTLGLPYCLLIAGRTEFGNVYPRAVAILTGVLAAIAFGFKPWLLAVPFALELLYLAKRRSLRSVWRAETVALGGGLFAYAVAILLFAPDYLTFTLPLARATYWAYDKANASVLIGALRPSFEPLLVTVVLLAISRSLPAYALGLLAACAGFSFSYWMQRKGFVYHAYPVGATVLVLLAFAGAHACRAILAGRYARAWVRGAAACAVALFVGVRIWDWVWPATLWLAIYDMRTGSVGVDRAALVAKLDELTPEGGYVYAFSTHPFPAFPTLSYARAESASAFPGQFTVPALVWRDQVSDPEKLAAIDRAVAVQRDYVVREFGTYRPQVVLVDERKPRFALRGRPFDDVAFYTADPRFAEIWRDYRELGKLADVRIFVRTR